MGFGRLPLVVVAAALLAPASSAMAQQRPTEVVLREARDAVGAGHRPDALRILETQLTANPRDVDTRLLYGLVLSWSTRYDDARRELEQVLRQSPTYSDARVALANVEWWSGRHERLQHIAADGLRQQPDSPQWLLYEARALDGLGRSAEARNTVDLVLAREPGHVQARALAERLDAKLRPWSAQLTHTVDWFDDDRQAWKETAATIGRVTPVGTVLTRASYSERFGVSDTQIEIEAYPRIRPGTYGYINVGGSVDHRLYPRNRAGLELYQSLGGGFEASAGWRRLEFSRLTNIYVGTLTKYAGHWMLSGRVYYIPREPADSTSYHGLLRRYFGADGTSFVGAGYSRGLAREEVRNVGDLLQLNSDTYRAELDWRLRPRLRAVASGSSSRQERSIGPLRQQTFSASLRVLF